MANRQNRQNLNNNININNNNNNNNNINDNNNCCGFADKTDKTDKKEIEKKRENNLDDNCKYLLRIMDNDYANNKYDYFQRDVLEMLNRYFIEDNAVYTETTDELYE